MIKKYKGTTYRIVETGSYSKDESLYFIETRFLFFFWFAWKQVADFGILETVCRASPGAIERHFQLHLDKVENTKRRKVL